MERKFDSRLMEILDFSEESKNETSDGEGKTTDGVGETISEYMRTLQKKSSEARKKNDPNTYKRMARLRWEGKEDLTIIVE